MSEANRLDMLSTGDNASPERAIARSIRKHSRPFRLDDVKLGALAARALSEGGNRLSESATEWDVAGKGKQRCIAPRTIDLITHEGLTTPVGPRLFQKVRCRRCEPCLKARSAYWKLGAMAEIGKSARTWFVTLTWRPEERLRCEYSANLRLAQAGIAQPCAADHFAARFRVLAPEVTKYLKRIRAGTRSKKEAPVRFRYLLVWEDHKCECDECEPLEHSLPGHYGFPHAHLLIHEQKLNDLPWLRVTEHWHAGFSKARLVESADPAAIHRDAAYTCKYMAKSMLSRVRASTKYGRTLRP